MSIIFFDGFDFYNSAGFGPGGRKWDQGSGGLVTGGRFGGQGLLPSGGVTGGYSPTTKTFTSSSEVIVGFAMNVANFSGINKPFLAFFDGTTPQCSLWVDPTTNTITVRQELGQNLGDSTLGDSGFVPPLTLWFYIEVKMQIGNPGSFQINVAGTPQITVTGVQTQKSTNASTNKIALSSLQSFSTNISIDDLYIIDTTDATNNVDFLGEVRVQTQYPDADGFENDFFPSVGTNNSANVNTTPTDYAEHGVYNYSGTVGAVDLYSIGNFTISGTIFAVQENLSFRKDDVGNRQIAPLLRTASTNYQGTSVPCYSTYTWAGKIWENNPNGNVPWDLVDLNIAQFGIDITS
jgi:hypothetical protein